MLLQEQNKKFRDELKKRLYKFTLQLIEYIDKLGKDNVSKRLGGQLLRSGTSVIANFIEGQSASSRKDFTNFLMISLKSSNESKLWLSLLKDSKRADRENAAKLINGLQEISNILASIILKLKGKK